MLVREQKRIEKQLADVQEHVYGRDSAYYAKLRADSIAQAQADSLEALGKSARTSRRGAATSRRSSLAQPSHAPKRCRFGQGYKTQKAEICQSAHQGTAFGRRWQRQIQCAPPASLSTLPHFCIAFTPHSNYVCVWYHFRYISAYIVFILQPSVQINLNNTLNKCRKTATINMKRVILHPNS